MPHRRPLAEVKNFGPVTLAEFHAMGLFTLDQLEELGFEEVCRKWIEHYPQRLNANAFLGVVCALEETVWTEASQSQRTLARRLAESLRHELGRGAKRTR